MTVQAENWPPTTDSAGLPDQGRFMASARFNRFVKGVRYLFKISLGGVENPVKHNRPSGSCASACWHPDAVGALASCVTPFKIQRRTPMSRPTSVTIQR